MVSLSASVSLINGKVPHLIISPFSQRNNIMQYAFINRAETACSMKWYQLKGKESYMVEHVGQGMTDEARIRLAKRLAKRSMTKFLEQEAPTRDPHPDSEVDKRLRKRGLITDDTDEIERKRLYSMYRRRYSESDSEVGY